MNHINFINGGKLGDFIHGLFAVKNICRQQNKKADLYLYDMGWELGIDTAFRELYPIVTSQEYINSFAKLTDYKIENNDIQVFHPKLVEESYTNIGNYIRSAHLYQKCWTEIFLLDYELPFIDYAWIQYDKKNTSLENKVLINRRTTSPERLNDLFPYEKILDSCSSKPIFIGTSIEDFEIFPHKNMCDFYQINTISDFYTAINSCKIFIGNLSSPLSIASSLDIPRIVELPFRPDMHHWWGEIKYSKNITMYLNEANQYGIEV